MKISSGNFLIDMLCISFVLCFIIDVSGVLEEYKYRRFRKLFKTKDYDSNYIRIPKPFSCSLCMIFWCGLVWMVAINEISVINVFIVCLFSSASMMITATIIFVRDLFITVQQWILKQFE